MKKMFAILDEKAKVYLTPFFSDNAATASRALEAEANNKQSFFGMYPADYSIHLVGEFDEQTGVVKPSEIREYCFRMVDLVRERKSVVPAVLDAEAKKEAKQQ